VSRGLVKISTNWKICRNIINFNISFLIIVSKKVISNLYVLGLTILIYILDHMNITNIVTKYFSMIIIQIIINESIFHPKNLCYGRNILRLDGSKGYRILFLRRPRNETVFKKLISFTSALPIHFTIGIVSIQIICHRESSGLRILKVHLEGGWIGVRLI